MCKIKQLSGDAPKYNNYCTSREYEVFCMIAKDENFKVGDLISGEQLTNKTKSLMWEITECNRVDGGHVSIKDNNGRERTCMFVFGKGTQKPATKPAQVETTATVEEVTHTPAETVQEIATVQAAPATPVNDDISQFTNFLGGMQKNAYDKGYLKGIEVANSEKQRIIDELKAENETLKNQPQVKGTVINLTIEGKTTTKVIQAIVNPNAEEILDYLKEGENVFLWGPAGAGKNVLGEQLADMLNVDFYYMNTVYTKYDITGFTDAQGNYIPTAVINWLRASGGLLFLDEICTNAPEANTAINALLANKYIVLQNGEVLKMTSRHYVVAADNTNGLGATEEYNGRYKMDESTRDRFAFFFIDYDAAVEESIVGDKKDILSFIYDLRRITKDCNISLILGYRCITRLVKFYTRDAVRTIDHNITKGMEQDTINEIASRLDNSTKWHKAFKSLVK